MQKIGKLLKGYLIALIIFGILSVLSAVLLRYTGLPETESWIYLLTAAAVSCLYLGMYTGKLYTRRGLLTGLVFSTVLMALILAATICCTRQMFTADVSAFLWLLPALPGGIGGIIGANAVK